MSQLLLTNLSNICSLTKIAKGLKMQNNEIEMEKTTG
jgi:hypothetical protein